LFRDPEYYLGEGSLHQNLGNLPEEMTMDLHREQLSWQMSPHRNPEDWVEEFPLPVFQGMTMGQDREHLS